MLLPQQSVHVFLLCVCSQRPPPSLVLFVRRAVASALNHGCLSQSSDKNVWSSLKLAPLVGHGMAEANCVDLHLEDEVLQNARPEGTAEVDGVVVVGYNTVEVHAHSGELDDTGPGFAGGVAGSHAENVDSHVVVGSYLEVCGDKHDPGVGAGSADRCCCAEQVPRERDLVTMVGAESAPCLNWYCENERQLFVSSRNRGPKIGHSLLKMKIIHNIDERSVNFHFMLK